MIPRLAVTIHLTSKVGSSCRAAATSEGTSGKREERSRRPYRSVLVSLVPHSFPSSIRPLLSSFPSWVTSLPTPSTPPERTK